MMILVSYDVCTIDNKGKKRLRNIAKSCLDYCQRVQNSVFECNVDPAIWTSLKTTLLKQIDPQQDSLRFYLLGSNWKRRVEHIGAKQTPDLNGPLIA